MREINGILYSDLVDCSIEVTNAVALDDMMILVTFNTGEKKLYDATQLLSMPAFQNLKNLSIFNNICIEDGVITWDNGTIDIAPETVYANSFSYEPKDILSA